MNKLGTRSSSSRSGEDRISSLPDVLLCRILSNLPTNIVVRTSVLSTRWKSLWLSIPLLDSNIDDFPDYITFASFVSRFLGFSKDPFLFKLKLSFWRKDSDLSSITSWIETAVVIRRIRHLEVDCRMSSICDPIPLSLYSCETLVSLKLCFLALPSFEFASLPNLKKMHLEENLHTDKETLANLISSCPVLEELTVIRTVDETSVKVLRVCSQTLNSLHLFLDSCKSWYIDDSDDWEVLIDAPRLAYLKLEDDQSVSFAINSLGLFAKVDLDVSFNVYPDYDLNDSFERSNVGKLLAGLSSVKDMTISETTFKIICYYLRHEPMPQFHNMTRFQTEFVDVSDLEKLPDFLESCPNLKSLVLKLEGVPDKEELSLSSVPNCLQSSLQYIEMTTRSDCGIGIEMKLTKYFLENSAVLKRFTLRLDCSKKEQESIIVMELKKLQRCSNACEVSVVRLEDDVTVSISL